MDLGTTTAVGGPRAQEEPRIREVGTKGEGTG